MKIPKVLNKNLLLKKCEVEVENKKTLILTPDSIQKPNNRYKVIGIGSEVKEIKVGDEIITYVYGGTELKFKDEEYIIMNTDHVLAVV